MKIEEKGRGIGQFWRREKNLHKPERFRGFQIQVAEQHRLNPIVFPPLVQGSGGKLWIEVILRSKAQPAVRHGPQGGGLLKEKAPSDARRIRLRAFPLPCVHDGKEGSQGLTGILTTGMEQTAGADALPHGRRRAVHFLLGGDSLGKPHHALML